ncbi:xanthine dehydrogenase molybdopterin binding subunit [Malikia spinosa]|uniref:xanthine dehydrogenase molybdopterin binding subunit n=1 Tax=Malikia spinosa TaxID=86180 RepID=UPI003FA32C2F
MNHPALPPSGACGQALPHESARAHVTGAAPFIDDLPELAGTLHAAPILSPLAHGRLLGLDTAAALALPGVIGLVLAADIPGHPLLPTSAQDEPLLAQDELLYAGQVIGLAVATDRETARRAARLVQLRTEALPALLSARAAHAASHYVAPPVHLARGDVTTALAQAPHRLTGSLESGAQEHFYLEGQVAYALPQEQGQWLVHASTQHPGEVQHAVASALGLCNHDVQVVCRRMGGGFGGKETQASQVAIWAALAAHKFARPVKLRLDRDDDFLITGKRHAFSFDWEAGFDDQGRLLALELTELADCGFSADLSVPICDRAVFHSDNAYFLEHVAIHSWRCRTHKQSSTAFRGFGGPQGMLVIETIMGEIARRLGQDPLEVRRINLYGTQERHVTHYGMPLEDNILAPLIDNLVQSARYRERRAAIMQWNAANPVIKRGLALTPVKFGISFTATQLNQAGALVHVYTDGSVLLNHGGTEMGQGLHTKVAQIVAQALGLPLASVRVSASDTARVPNASATAASTGTDLNGRAAQLAAIQVRERLARFVAEQDGCSAAEVRFEQAQVVSPKVSRAWKEVVAAAYSARIQLWSDGYYRTPKIHYDPRTLTGRPFYYFAYGAACTEVAIDLLTGESRVLAVDILHDVGRSINPALDIGQIEGGFIQGMGWLTSEELVWDAQGRLLTHGPSSYKIPSAGDLPAEFRIELWPEANREDNVYGSKAVGEPPFMLAISVWEALRDAVAQARGDGQPVRLDAPATPERLLRALGGLD